MTDDPVKEILVLLAVGIVAMIGLSILVYIEMSKLL